MADKKISELPIIETPSGSAIIPIVVDSTNSYSTANTNAISASALAFYVGQQLNAARTNTTNTFANTQNFDGAVFLNGDVNIVGNVIGGIRNEIDSLNTTTSSLIGITNGLMAFTSALDSTYATDEQLLQLYQATASIHFTTQSLNIQTGSYDSVNLGISEVTSSLNSYTSSNESWKDGVRGEISGIEAYTASLKGAIEVNGQDVNVLGMITAQQFNVTYVSSSTMYQSGSTKFGDTSDDRHEFTGSIFVSDSLEVVNLTGSLLSTNGVVSSSTQISNYYKFAETASSNTFYGTQTFSGSFNVSGSTVQTGDNTLIGNTILSGSIFISGSRLFTGETITIGNTILSGSIAMSGSTIQSGDNTLTGNNTITGSNLILGDTVMSGSIDVSGSSNFHNSRFVVTGSSYFTGSHYVDGNSVFSGSINIASGSSYYRAGNKLFNYGQWGSLETQSGSINTAYAMKFDTKYNGSEGVYVANNGSGFPTRLTIENTGLYNIQFSAQLHTTATEACDFSVWFAMTGSNMADSNTDFSVEKISGGGFGVAALNLLIPITAGDYVELYWSNDTGNGQLQYKAPQSTPTRPATPSIIVTVTQIA